MNVNWARVFNRLFEMIDSREAYFGGGRFISTIREVDPYFPDYTKYMDERRSTGKSTSRKDYYYDILMAFDEHDRVRVLHAFIDRLKDIFPDKIAALQDELGGGSAVPPVRIGLDAWNSDRLNRYLSEIDHRIGAGNYAGAVTVAYTCLEGFLKAFVRARILHFSGKEEILDLSRAVRTYLRNNMDHYPDEALNMLTHIAHSVDKARNRYSESHFDREADRWLAVFVRDLVNAEIRLLLQFI